MPGREQRTQVRGAVARGDGVALVALLSTGEWPEPWLQLVGDGLLAAVASAVDGAVPLASRCLESLRERDWEGDAELAAALASRLGSGPAPLLRSVPVDLEELAGILEGDPVYGGGRVDLRTGEVLPQSILDDPGDLEDDLDDEKDGDTEEGERWLWVDCEGSRAAYGDMEVFIATVEDPDRADRLEIAIAGRGAFRRFKDVIARWPELQDRWYAFSEDRTRGRARAWLADRGYAPRTGHPC